MSQPTEDPTPDPPPPAAGAQPRTVLPAANPARGRHRDSSATRRAPSRLTALLLAGAALLVVAVAVALAVTSGAPAPDSTASSPRAASPTGATSKPSAVPSSTPLSGGLALRRTVNVRGNTVTVDEQFEASASTPVVVAPRRSTADPALVPLSLRLVAQDGTEAPFDEPVTVNAGGSLTVRGLYRLRYCPDLVPLAWPSTVTVTTPGVPVDVVRSDEPLRNARAVCPGVPPESTAAPGLRVVAFSGSRAVATVRLVWTQRPRATLDAVGAPSGFPLDAVGPRCPGGCVAALVPGRRVAVQLRPVDGCPSSSQRSDGLPLLVSEAGGGRPQVVSVSVKGLGRWFSTACR